MPTNKYNTSLCLACSASLPPNKPNQTALFYTQCCDRPICPRCISSNPRLARYNPCLSCLGGVDIVGSKAKHGLGKNKQEQNRNIDGAVRDEDTFVLGDDDEDEDQEGGRTSPPPAYSSGSSSPSSVTSKDTGNTSHSSSYELPENNKPDNSNLPPPVYYIKKGDTLQGIAFRYGVDGRELCRLNKLPPTTLSTTPHLLHTRVSLTFPPSRRAALQGQDIPNGVSAEEVKEREARRARERAEKKLQTLTKEVDWRVARAYVAIAEDDELPLEARLKMKEMKTGNDDKRPSNSNGASSSSALESAAVDNYLEDEEWEQEQIRQGRGVNIQEFPYSKKALGDTEKPGDSGKTWWKRLRS